MGAGQSADFHENKLSNSNARGSSKPDAFMLATAFYTKETVGGCECDKDKFFGGAANTDPLKDLNDYENSLSAKTKEEVIRRLARGLKRAGINVDPDGEIDEIVRQFVLQIPNPKNGKTFASDAKSQEKVCRVIADVLNDEFSPGITKNANKFIDTSSNATEICRRVSEWGFSFTMGVNTEFLAVHASVRNAIRNIEILSEVMRNAHNNVLTKINNIGNDEVKQTTYDITQVYKSAEKERTHQERVLKNILNIQLSPAAEALKTAMGDASDQNAMVKRIGIKPGTSEFADSLASAISGLGNAASIAARVHKALKQVGASVREYLESPGFIAFQKLMDTKIEQGEVKSSDLAKFIEAMGILRMAFDDRKDNQFTTEIAKLSDEDRATGGYHTGGRRMQKNTDHKGGADDDETLKTEVDKQLARVKLEKRLIIHDFSTRMARHYNELLASVRTMGPELGKKIPITDKTDQLKESLTRLKSMRDSKNIELALIGYYTDTDSRAKKDRFLAGLTSVSKACDALMSLDIYREGSAYIVRLKSAIDSLIKTIDYYSDTIVKKFGGMDCPDDTKMGGAEGDDLVPIIARSSVDLDQAVKEFEYSYYVAKVRVNLEKSSQELDSYGAKYPELIGDAVGIRLWTLKNQKETALKHITDEKRKAAATACTTAGNPALVHLVLLTAVDTTRDALTVFLSTVDGDISAAPAAAQLLITAYDNAVAAVAGAAPAPNNDTKRAIALFKAFGAVSTVAAPNPTGDAAIIAARKMIEQQYTMREKFYKALQALDLYMKAFTSGIAKDPDATRDIKKMLDGLDLNAYWFNENTGNFIYTAFDHMGGMSENKYKRDATTARRVILDTDATRPHYYQKIENVTTADTPLMGVPQIGINLQAAPVVAPATTGVDHAAGAKKAVSDAVDYFQALKNIINAFAHIGDRFGGHDIRSQVFMSPTQIFKILSDYLKVSAISLHGDPEDDTKAPPASINMHINTGERDEDLLDSVEPYQIYFGSTSDSHKGNYSAEDQYFILMMKSMATKIMTTLGMYNMIERENPKSNLTTLRMIVGGDDMNPEIIADAAELYFRLPRLGEFYRGLFTWDGLSAALKISMMVDFEGIFAGLIRIIFQKRVSLADGDYSDSEIRDIVREINQIYAHYFEKSNNTAITDALNGFVVEFNRRYGIIKTEDYKSYLSLFQLRGRDPASLTDNNNNSMNFSILPDEDELEITHRAPSDRITMAPLSNSNRTTPTEFTGKITLDDDITTPTSRRFILRTFRKDLDDKFANVTPATFGRTSYISLIRQSTTDLQKTNNPTLKLAIAAKLIKSNSSIDLDIHKSYMFHETVVVGLNTLSSITSIIDRFEEQLNVMDPVVIENKIINTLYRSAGVVLAALNKTTLQTIQANNVGDTHTKYIMEGGNVQATDVAIAYNCRNGLRVGTQTRLMYEFARVKINAAAVPGAAPLALPLGNGITATELAAGINNLEKVRNINTNQQFTDAHRQYIANLKFASRHLVDYGLIMEDLIESLFTLSSGDLIDVKFTDSPNSPISINFSKLINRVETLINEIKYYMDHFRTSFPQDTIKRFEEMGYTGSLYSLEEKLLEKRIRGAISNGVINNELTLEGIIRKANTVFINLTRDTGVEVNPAIQIAGFVGSNAQMLAQAGDAHPSRVESYGRTLSAITYYDASSSINSGLDGVDVTPAALSQIGIEYLMRPVGALCSIAPVALTTLRTPAAVDIRRTSVYSLDSATPISSARSLVFAFNQTLARYLQTLCESTTRKIYANLITPYANSVAAPLIGNPLLGFPDLMTVANIGRLGDIKSTSILTQSLAFAIHHLVRDVPVRMTTPTHLITTMTDVPLYLKENYRANLPGFVKLFDLIVQKCSFIKMLLQKTQISCSRPRQTRWLVDFGINIVVAAAPVAIAANGHRDTNLAALDVNNYLLNGLTALDQLDPVVADPVAAAMFIGKTSNTMKQQLYNIIDAVSNHAYVLYTSASEVLRELADPPIYLQVQENSIETYKIRNNKMPTMPLSLSLFILNDMGFAAAIGGAAVNGFPASLSNPVMQNIVGGNQSRTQRFARETYFYDKTLYPMHTLGSLEFKLQYGVRGLLMQNNPLTFEDMPGIKSDFAEYNVSSGGSEPLDEDRYLKFTNNTLYLLRYIADARNYKNNLTIQTNSFISKTFIKTAKPAAAIPAENLSYIEMKGNDPTLTTDDKTSGCNSYAIAQPVNATNANLSNIISVVESLDEEVKTKIVVIVSSNVNTNSGKTRSRELIDNIIEMNIMPVNVHALMRGVPFANLYNYEHTFESMLVELYNEAAPTTYQLNDDLSIDAVSTRNMFLRMMRDPYLKLQSDAAITLQNSQIRYFNYGSDTVNTENKGYVHRIFRGDADLGLGRPKFLSDQVFNKCLFSSIYKEDELEDTGPVAASARDRSSRPDLSLGPNSFIGIYLMVKQAVSILNDLKEEMKAMATRRANSVDATNRYNAEVDYTTAGGAAQAGNIGAFNLAMPAATAAGSVDAQLTAVFGAMFTASAFPYTAAAIANALTHPAQGIDDGYIGSLYATNSLLDMDLDRMLNKLIQADKYFSEALANLIKLKDYITSEAKRLAINMAGGPIIARITGLDNIIDYLDKIVNNTCYLDSANIPIYKTRELYMGSYRAGTIKDLIRKLTKAKAIIAKHNNIQTLKDLTLDISYGMAFSLLDGMADYYHQFSMAANITRMNYRTQIHAYLTELDSRLTIAGGPAAATFLGDIVANSGPGARNLLTACMINTFKTGAVRPGKATAILGALTVPTLNNAIEILGAVYTLRSIYNSLSGLQPGGWNFTTGLPAAAVPAGFLRGAGGLGGGGIGLLLKDVTKTDIFSLTNTDLLKYLVDKNGGVALNLTFVAGVNTRVAGSTIAGTLAAPAGPAGAAAPPVYSVAEYIVIRDSNLMTHAYDVVITPHVTDIQIEIAVATVKTITLIFVNAILVDQKAATKNNTLNPSNVVSLKYLTTTPDKKSGIVGNANIRSVRNRQVLEMVGRMRFDTRFIRNLFFITNLLRVIRLKLNRDITKSNSALVSAHSALAMGLTEYGSDPYSANESFDSNSFSNAAKPKR